MAIQFPEWWSFLSTFRIFLCSMLMHVPIHGAFPPVRKEQVCGGSFLHLLLIPIVFSSFTIEFNGLPVDFIDCKNKKDLRFCKSWVKIGSISTSSLECQWWGASYANESGSLAISCASGEKKPELGDKNASSFIRHGLTTQKVEVLSCICSDVKKLLINLSYFPNQLKILEFGKK